MRCTNRSLRSRKLALTVPQAAAIWPGQRRKDALVRRPFDCRLGQPRMETLRSNGNMTRVAKPSGSSPRSRRLLRADDGEFCGKGSVVRLGGLEPPTSGSTIRRSNQLSYNRTSLPGASPRETQRLRSRMRRSRIWRLNTDNRPTFQDFCAWPRRARWTTSGVANAVATAAIRAKKKAGGGDPAFFL